MIKKVVLFQKGVVLHMGNVILFANAFLSYLLLMVIIVAIAGAAVFIGIKMRKNKNSKLQESQVSGEQKAAS